MTIDEAILELESIKRVYAHIRRNDTEWEAVEMAVAALRAQQESEKNEPLTLDELREMDGDRIYIEFIGSCKEFCDNIYAPYYGDMEQYIDRYNGMMRGFDLPLKYYAKNWFAYRRPPKEK